MAHRLNDSAFPAFGPGGLMISPGAFLHHEPDHPVGLVAASSEVSESVPEAAMPADAAIAQSEASEVAPPSEEAPPAEVPVETPPQAEPTTPAEPTAISEPTPTETTPQPEAASAETGKQTAKTKAAKANS